MLIASPGFATRNTSAGDVEPFQLSETQRSAAARFVGAYKVVRDHDYGNVQLKVSETLETIRDNKTTRSTTASSYWSRDNQYFRIDSKTESGAASGGRSRLIVAPDGFMFLETSPSDESLKIRGWGSASEGADKLGGYFFYQAAARGFGPWDPDTVFCKLVPEQFDDPDLKTVAGQTRILDVALSDDGLTLTVKWKWESKPISAEASLACNVDKGVILHFDAQNYKDGVLTHVHKVDKEYDFVHFGSIPSHDRQQLTYPTGGGYSRLYQTQQVSWSPVPIGIFSLEAQGLGNVRPGSVWDRRAMSIVIGIILVGFYFAIKWYHRRASL
jgi:hypothetical protein